MHADNTATRKFGGTGMGLALFKRIVNAHGAVVRVKSAVGEGTRVTLAWPASKEAATAAAATAAARAAAATPDQIEPSHAPEPVVPVQ